MPGAALTHTAAARPDRETKHVQLGMVGFRHRALDLPTPSLQGQTQSVSATVHPGPLARCDHLALLGYRLASPKTAAAAAADYTD